MADTLPNPTQVAVRRYRKLYLPLQCSMVAAFSTQVMVHGLPKDIPKIIILLDLLGAGLFLYCLNVLYVAKTKTLITSGPFRFTRHPMYTGFLMMGVRVWWPACPLDAVYWCSMAVFVLSIFVAGYMQEKETLVHFGADAEDYYRRTPRCFLWYPFC